MRSLEKLTIRGFKSIREQTLHLGPLNVFIGGNGVGKSNLIQVFRFLREIVNQNLAGYTLTKGGANALLYKGRSVTSKMNLELEFGEGDHSNSYRVEISPTDDDLLVVQDQFSYQQVKRNSGKPYDVVSIRSSEASFKGISSISAKQAICDLEGCSIYHFHDTSDTAAVKATCDLEDNEALRPQAENLAAFLYWMQEKRPNHFRNIEDTVKQIAPFFDEFRLRPSRLNENKIRLEWKEVGSDAYFNASSLSDGTLRFICLATLLLQPDLPAVLLLDEPELGLHPAAITLLAELLSSAATKTQVIVATQSVTLVNQFTPEEVWAVDRIDGQSSFKRLSEADTSNWLDDYALGDLWEKNLIGARP